MFRPVLEQSVRSSPSAILSECLNARVNEMRQLTVEVAQCGERIVVARFICLQVTRDASFHQRFVNLERQDPRLRRVFYRFLRNLKNVEDREPCIFVHVVSPQERLSASQPKSVLPRPLAVYCNENNR